jgi:hypothetical protein
MEEKPNKNEPPAAAEGLFDSNLSPLTLRSAAGCFLVGEDLAVFNVNDAVGVLGYVVLVRHQYEGVPLRV